MTANGPGRIERFWKRLAAPRASRDLGSLESALAQPKATFGGADRHTTLPAQAPATASELSAKNDINSGQQQLDLRSGELADPFRQQHLVECDDL